MTEAELDAICAAWPGVARSIKWEVDLVYSVANKMFAVLCTLGPERGRLSFKVEPERFLELTDQPGIAPAPYMARAFWITLANPAQFGGARLQAFLRRSYDLVVASLPRKAQASLAPPAAQAVAPAAGHRSSGSAKPLGQGVARARTGATPRSRGVVAKEKALPRPATVKAPAVAGPAAKRADKAEKSSSVPVRRSRSS